MTNENVDDFGVKAGGKVTVVVKSSDVATPFVETVLLTPSNSANLPKARERSPKTDTFSGYLEIAGLKAGTYSISHIDGRGADWRWFFQRRYNRIKSS